MKSVIVHCLPSTKGADIFERSSGECREADHGPLTSLIPPAGRHEEIKPRLLNLRQAGVYLGCSYWTIRDWLLAGHIPTIDLPPLQPRAGDKKKPRLRRVLIDKRDLDAFIDARKVRTGRPDTGETE